MTIKDCLQMGSKQLQEAQIEEPRLKIKLLLSDVLKKPKESFIIDEEMEIEDKLQTKIEEGLKKLKQGMPIQYITHRQFFRKLSFYVDENVLIPQPDTEILVEKVEECLTQEKEMDLLEIGTGSGAIAISLAKEVENIQIEAIDISEKALEVAKYNGEQNNVDSNKITWTLSDLFEKIGNKKFDGIVSNPPYIKTQVISTLSKEVRQEPMLALDGGVDGLMFYRKIIDEAIKHLKPKGFLALEIGYDQKEDVMELLKANKEYVKIETVCDLTGLDRVIIAKKG